MKPLFADPYFAVTVAISYGAALSIIAVRVQLCASTLTCLPQNAENSSLFSLAAPCRAVRQLVISTAKRGTVGANFLYCARLAYRDVINNC